MRLIMLSKKFGSLYTDRVNADLKEQKRLRKMVEKDEKRKESILKPGNI